MFDSLNVMRPRLANVHSEGIVVQFRKDNDFETVEFGIVGRKIQMVYNPKRHRRSIEEWYEQLYRHGFSAGIAGHQGDFEGTVGLNNRVVLLMDPLSSMDERTAGHLYHRTLLVHCYKSAYTHELDKSLRAYQFAPLAYSESQGNDAQVFWRKHSRTVFADVSVFERMTRHDPTIVNVSFDARYDRDIVIQIQFRDGHHARIQVDAEYRSKYRGIRMVSCGITAPQATRRRAESTYGLDDSVYAGQELFRKHLFGQWEV